MYYFSRLGFAAPQAAEGPLSGRPGQQRVTELASRLVPGPPAIPHLCVGSLIEAVRDRTKTVDLKQINAVLMQPHWRHNTRDEAQQPAVFTNQKPKG